MQDDVNCILRVLGWAAVRNAGFTQQNKKCAVCLIRLIVDMDAVSLKNLPLASKSTVNWLMEQFENAWSAKFYRSTRSFSASLYDYSGQSSFFIDISREGDVVTIKVHGKGVYARPGSKLSKEFRNIMMLMNDTESASKDLKGQVHEYVLLQAPVRLDERDEKPSDNTRTVSLLHEVIDTFPEMLEALQTTTLSGFIVRFDMGLSHLLFDKIAKSALGAIAEEIVRLPAAISINDSKFGQSFLNIFYDSDIVEKVHRGLF
jgi:hypothetical protein